MVWLGSLSLQPHATGRMRSDCIVAQSYGLAYKGRQPALAVNVAEAMPLGLDEREITHYK